MHAPRPAVTLLPLPPTSNSSMANRSRGLPAATVRTIVAQTMSDVPRRYAATWTHDDAAPRRPGAALLAAGSCWPKAELVPAGRTVRELHANTTDGRHAGTFGTMSVHRDACVC